MADYTLIGWTPEVTKLSAANFAQMDAGIQDAVRHHKSGLASALPGATAANKNWLYFATDKGVVYANLDGNNWTRWSADAPTAALQDFAGFTLPAGWLDADGTALNRSVFGALVNAITKTFSGSNASGVNTITNVLASSLTHVGVGCTIEGPGIAAGVTVTAISAAVGGFQDITLSANASSTNSGATFRALPYGGGDGSTTFNLPDFQGRGSVGSGAGAGLTARKMGQKGGAETHLHAFRTDVAARDSDGMSGFLSPFNPEYTNEASIFTNFLPLGFPAGGVQVTTRRRNTQASDGMDPFLAARKIIKVY